MKPVPNAVRLLQVIKRIYSQTMSTPVAELPPLNKFMIKVLDVFRRHPLLVFTVLTYGFSWLLWGLAPSPFRVWLGGFGPAFGAILLAQVFIWRVHPGWYLVALGLPVVGTVALIVLYALGGETLSRFQMLTAWLSALGQRSGFLVLTLLFGALIVMGEEMGWRGYVLPKLQAHHSDLYASLGTGALWGLWHLPALWPFQPNREAMDLLFFLADILVISVIYTWLYTNSRGSLLIICLFHSAYDVLVIYASATLPFLGTLKGYELLVLLLIAAGIVIRTGTSRWAETQMAAQQS
jgi:membrane protease YdiL (CAAX protease family)